MGVASYTISTDIYAEMKFLRTAKLNAADTEILEEDLSVLDLIALDNNTICEKQRIEFSYRLYRLITGDGYSGYYGNNHLYFDFLQDCKAYKFNVAMFNPYGDKCICTVPLLYGWAKTYYDTLYYDVWYEMEMFGEVSNIEIYKNAKAYIKFIDDTEVNIRLDYRHTEDILGFIAGQNLINHDRYLKQSYKDKTEMQTSEENVVFDGYKYLSITMTAEYDETIELYEVDPIL